MLTPPSRGMRSGFSVLELLVAMVVGTLCIATVGSVAFRQQRFHRDVVAATERMEQIGQTTALVPITLRSIAPGEGDIRSGAARDTSLEFRATIATGVVCDSTGSSVILASTHPDNPRLASVLSRPDVGDTLWTLMLADTSESWTPRAITAVVDSTVTCRLGRVSPWPGLVSQPALVVRIASALPGPGAVVRITRASRYSIYRSSDGNWYLGARDWNAGSGRFNTIQPVSGPFLSAAAQGLTFRYVDSLGATIPAGASDTRGIALIQIEFRIDTVLPGSFAHAVGVTGSGVISVGLRNAGH